MYNFQIELNTEIKFNSTNSSAPVVSFREALLKGLAPDGGLYIPLQFPKLSIEELKDISALDYPHLATEILGRLICNDINKDDLRKICKEIYTFPIPLEKVTGNIFLMHLDEGPTASFKDYAALMMGKLMQYFLLQDNKKITILTATSGDTGSAVANAFHGLENIRVIILFPSGEVTEMQRKQMTTYHDNIQVIEIEGKFDDCQKLVKTAFMDSSLSGKNLSSANSINIGRLLPQSVYYFWAWAKLSGKPEDKFNFSVPCGNFGNLAGGIIAKKMGLPVVRFIISTNENDEVPQFFRTESYEPVSPSRNCLSSAMNVGHPSNLARILSMYGGRMDEKGILLQKPDLKRMKQDFFATSISDQKTIETIRSFYQKYGKLLEPHGAVAWTGLMEYFRIQHSLSENDYSVCLETAHPAKFSGEIRRILNIEPDIPDSLLKIQSRKEEYISLENNYDLLRKFIIQNY
jgi:threonine synthase